MNMLKLAIVRRCAVRRFCGASKTQSNPTINWKKFFDRAFKDERVRSTYVSWDPQQSLAELASETEKSFFIIDEPKARLAFPLIGFDPSEAAATLAGTFSKQGRDKALIATVRGMGGGKTRAFEELRRELMDMGNVLPLAITYNNQTKVQPFERTMVDDKINPRRVLTRTVVFRMACVLYEMTISPSAFLQTFPNNHAKRLTAPDAFLKWDDDDFVRGFVLHAVERVNKAREEQNVLDEQIKLKNRIVREKVTRFALLIDEFVAVAAAVGLDGPEKDALAPIRSALLDWDDTPYETALAVSSLKSAPLGETESGRQILGLKLASKLDEAQIVDGWWKVSEKEFNLFSLLKRFASTVHDVPRAVQVAAEVLPEKRKLKEGVLAKSALELLGSADDVERIRGVKELWDGIIAGIRVKYQQTKINSSHLYPVLFCEEVEVKEDWVQKAVVRSIYTNQLEPSDSTFVPTTSLAMIAASGPDSGSALSNLIRQVVLEILQHHGEGAFEKCFMGWLRVRMLCASNCNKRTLPLDRLFDISFGDLEFFDLEIQINSPEVVTEPLPLSHGSSDDLQSIARNQFLGALATIHMGDQPIILQSSPMDLFGFVLFVKIMTTSKSVPYLIFFECKPQQKLKPKRRPRIDTTHYVHVEEVLYKHARTRPSDKNSALDAFQSGRCVRATLIVGARCEVCKSVTRMTRNSRGRSGGDIRSHVRIWSDALQTPTSIIFLIF
eukprot:c20755_g1_i1.p1 GENE.c20755_g1_i1~~c20755_g1_i1.p1  ORF type:complete len:725 (+),score=131.81 c20755_g1_i1:52-2226(+)